jgi:hypothetical protein
LFDGARHYQDFDSAQGGEESIAIHRSDLSRYVIVRAPRARYIAQMNVWQWHLNDGFCELKNAPDRTFQTRLCEKATLE